MKSRFLVLFICLLATVAMVGCNLFGSDDDNDVVSPAHGNLIIKVVDAKDNSTALTGSSFKIANSPATAVLQSDGKSYLLSNIVVNDKVLLQVSKIGYLDAHTSAAVTANNTTVTQVSLINESDLEKPNDTIDLSVADPQPATFTSGVSIKFKQNSVKNGATNVTNPAVTIAYKAPPATADAIAAFPGNFEGVDLTGKTVPFETYGFIYVDLGAGNELTETASLTMPTTAAAPATMPVWSYDETTGIWTQTGTASRKEIPPSSGKFYYEAAVDHFSWYNLDAPLENESTFEVTVASYVSTLDYRDVMEGNATDTSKTDLTKRVVGASVVVTTTLEDADSTDQWGVQASDNSNTFTRNESKLTDSNGVAKFVVPAGRKISIKVTPSTGGEPASAYSYEVGDDKVARAFVNMGSYATHGGTQGQTGSVNR